MPKMSLVGSLACKLTTVIWHIQRCFRHRKEDSEYCCDIKGYKHRKQWKCYYILFGQLYFWVLIWWRNNMSFSLCTHMNYRVLQVPSVQLWMDFACKGQRRVMWLPKASLVRFCWNQALPMRRLLSKTRSKSLFLPSRRFCHHFWERGRGLWLSCTASSYGPHRRQKPAQAAKTASSQRSFTPKVGGSPSDFLRAGMCLL